MALNCGWEILLTHRNGATKSTCGFSAGEEKMECCFPNCKMHVRCRKAYDAPVPPNADYQIQVGDRFWPKMAVKM